MDDFDLVRGVATEVLEAELKRRHETKRPEPLLPEQIEWEHVISYVEDATSKLEQGDGLPKDFEYHLFETVLEVMYGSDVWIWWNQKVDE